jgi:DNA-directed RNA polymerase subunit M/transcription elongation factor TFIIS
MIYCPCCSSLMLPHIRSSQIYWFCRHCWQEMPVFWGEKSNLLSESLADKIFTPPEKLKNHHTQGYTNEWMTIQQMPV